MPSCRKMWKNHDYKYHNTYEPGHEMQFDFAGDNLWIVDKETGEAVQAIVLVCLLPYSMLSYVTALPSAKMEYLFQALSRAVRYFGGVAEVSKTDNMRQWISKTHRYEPTLNEAASQWCLHHGTDFLYHICTTRRDFCIRIIKFVETLIS